MSKPPKSHGLTAMEAQHARASQMEACEVMLLTMGALGEHFASFELEVNGVHHCLFVKRCTPAEKAELVEGELARVGRERAKRAATDPRL